MTDWQIALILAASALFFTGYLVLCERVKR